MIKCHHHARPIEHLAGQEATVLDTFSQIWTGQHEHTGDKLATRQNNDPRPSEFRAAAPTLTVTLTTTRPLGAFVDESRISSTAVEVSARDFIKFLDEFIGIDGADSLKTRPRQDHVCAGGQMVFLWGQISQRPV